ncbi:nose resistant to fluoxetine protein 6-like, partial [Anoplophora glabripennis]|uniref:nose resistant to fluoxetine protein 6-like n=1 Tax=Anoplophora glabripennis TaxID=217634 RepID=UPI00087363C2
LDLWQIYPLNVFENTTTVTAECKNVYDEYLRRLYQNELNAAKMFDATAKLPSGILRGNVNQYGDFDECMELEEAQYCLADINIEPYWREPYLKFKNMVHSNFPIRETFDDPKHRVPGFTMIRWGFCIPKECTGKDLENAIYEKLNIPSRIRPAMCQKAKQQQSALTFGDIFTRYFFLSIAIAIGLSSILYSRNKLENTVNIWLQLLMCFAIQRNYKIIATIRKNENEIQALHGVRALSALALIISHKVMALFYNPFMNRSVMSENLGMKWSVIGRTAIIYTECFMLLSGLLSANSLFADLDKRKTMNFRDKLISRLFRILPNLIAVILFCTYLLPLMGSGPLWPLVVNHHSELCKRYMWRNILLIHNYFGFENMCLTHTHQVGIDMQLFLITPFFVYVIWKYGKAGFWISGAVALLSTILRFWVTWKNSLSHVVHFGIPVSRLFRTASLSYILPTHRITIYLIGIFLAYVLRYSKNTDISKRQRFIIWSILYPVTLSAWLGPIHMSQKDFKYNKMEAALYAALSPVFWGIGVSWVIYSINRGFGSWFGPLLKWKYFVPFTKIAYAVYLVQFPVFFYNVGKTRHVDEYKSYMMMQVVETGVIVLLSIILTLTIELPFQNIRKVIFRTGDKNIKIQTD